MGKYLLSILFSFYRRLSICNCIRKTSIFKRLWSGSLKIISKVRINQRSRVLFQRYQSQLVMLQRMEPVLIMMPYPLIIPYRYQSNNKRHTTYQCRSLLNKKSRSSRKTMRSDNYRYRIRNSQIKCKTCKSCLTRNQAKSSMRKISYLRNSNSKNNNAITYQGTKIQKFITLSKSTIRKFNPLLKNHLISSRKGTQNLIRTSSSQSSQIQLMKRSKTLRKSYKERLMRSNLDGKSQTV